MEKWRLSAYFERISGEGSQAPTSVWSPLSSCFFLFSGPIFRKCIGSPAKFVIHMFCFVLNKLMFFYGVLFFETGYVTKSGLELASSWRWPWTVILLLVCLKWWIIGFYPDLFSTRNKIQGFVNAGKHSIVWATLVSAVIVLNLIVSSTVPLWCLKEYFLKRDHFYFWKRGRGERERVCVGILECVYSETRKRCWILWPWDTSGYESPNVVAGNQSLVLWRQYMFLTSEPSLQPKGMLS